RRVGCRPRPLPRRARRLRPGRRAGGSRRHVGVGRQRLRPLDRRDRGHHGLRHRPLRGHGQGARRHPGRAHRRAGRDPHRRPGEHPVRRADRFRADDRGAAVPSPRALRRPGGEAVRWSLVWLVLGAAAAIAAPHVFDSLTARHLLVLIAINVILVSSLDLLIGGAGLLSLGHAGFMGVGAYASALLVKAGWAFPLGIVAALVAAAVAGLVVGVPALRLKGHYFSVVAFIVGIILTILMPHMVDLTRGPMGLTGIPFARLELFGWEHTFRTIIEKVGYYYLTLVFVALALLLRWRLGRSRFGRALAAIKGDENLAESVGIATYR